MALLTAAAGGTLLIIKLDNLTPRHDEERSNRSWKASEPVE